MSFYNKQTYPVYVNSRDRISGSCSDFIYKIELNENIDSVCLINAFVTKSYYTVQEPNNVFYLHLANVARTRIPITLEQGDYNIRVLEKTVSTLMTEASVNQGVNHTYVVDTNDLVNDIQDCKLHFSVSTSDAKNHPIINQPKLEFGNDLFQIFGFDKSSITEFKDNKVNSTNMVCLQKTSNLLLLSDLVDSANNGPQILAMLHSGASMDLSTISYQCYDVLGMSRKLSSKKGSYQFSLIDPTDNKIVNLNGIDWSMTLLFFDMNDIFELQRRSLLIDHISKITPNVNSFQEYQANHVEINRLLAERSLSNFKKLKMKKKK